MQNKYSDTYLTACRTALKTSTFLGTFKLTPFWIFRHYWSFLESTIYNILAMLNFWGSKEPLAIFENAYQTCTSGEGEKNCPVKGSIRCLLKETDAPFCLFPAQVTVVEGFMVTPFLNGELAFI